MLLTDRNGGRKQRTPCGTFEATTKRIQKKYRNHIRVDSIKGVLFGMCIPVGFGENFIVPTRKTMLELTT